ncbi:MAG: hypothetical protein OQK82_05790 [Candidatus Pacearchaeota archaeon]|nr:hypothetical protein [Candidatus Pacearchaeota archaeon]
MKHYIISALGLYLLTQGAAAFATHVGFSDIRNPVTRPPSFTADHDLLDPLKSYPLGSVNSQQVFSFHGEPLRELRLLNGFVGWVYEAGNFKKKIAYKSPNNETKTFVEITRTSNTHTYTLVFDTRGIVIDVLYNEQGRHDGKTALQLQRSIRGDQDITPPRRY